MDWFRMYGEFSSDPKVQSMCEVMQRRLVMLLCLRCNNTLATLQEEEIAFALRIDEDQLAQTKALFIKKAFINESWEIRQWDKRQFISDSSTARVARHRAAKKEAAEHLPSLDFTGGNVTVTPQNRTEAEQIQIHSLTQNRTNTKPIALPEWMPVDAWEGYIALRKSLKKPLSSDAMLLTIKKLTAMRADENDPRAVLEQSIMNGWTGLFVIKKSGGRAGTKAAAGSDKFQLSGIDRSGDQAAQDACMQRIGLQRQAQQIEQQLTPLEQLARLAGEAGATA